MSSEEPRAWMESDNRQWLAAFNAGKLDELVARYDEQATVVDPRVGPIQGSAAVKSFWREQLQTSTDHTFQIVDVYQRGDLAYQIAKWTVKLHGQRYAGYTIRIFECQADGKWLTKVHMLNLSLSPSLLWRGLFSFFTGLWRGSRI
jgi:ketosteroid isomerase-like protein